MDKYPPALEEESKQHSEEALALLVRNQRLVDVHPALEEKS